MIIPFINRESELETLTTLTNKQSNLVLLYGRRRVGKTRLVGEFLKNKNHLYFYVPNGEEKTILLEFSKTVEHNFFKGFQFNDFTSFIEYLTKKSAQGTIIAIDEFQRLTTINAAISQIQKYWDQKLSTSPCYLILTGSSIGTIRKVALNGNAPLYGRRTATLKIEPLKYLDLFKWFKNFSAEELVKIYASFGATPAYLEHVDENLNVDENIIQKILKKTSPLHDEPEMLLMQEIRTPQRYLDILSAIAQNKQALSEISHTTGLNRESTTIYLKTLELLDLIERITPITQPNAKKGQYRIKDPFFNFYFKFTRPNKRQIELNLEKNVWASLQEDFNRYLGRVFEAICFEVIVKMAKNQKLPINLAKIGKWWWKKTEIDLLGLNKTSNKAIAIEVKWSNLDRFESKRILFQLEQKVQMVQKVKDYKLGLMAKTIEQKEKLQNEGYFVLDLQDFQKQP